MPPDPGRRRVRVISSRGAEQPYDRQPAKLARNIGYKSKKFRVVQNTRSTVKRSGRPPSRPATNFGQGGRRHA